MLIGWVVFLSLLAAASTVTAAGCLITARKQRKNAQSYMRDFSRAMKCPVLIWTADLSYVELNPAAKALFADLNDAQRGNLPLTIFLPEMKGDFTETELMMAALTGTVGRAVQHAGGAREILWSSVVHDTQGGLRLFGKADKRYIISVGSDETLRLKLESALEDSENAAREMVYSLNAITTSSNIGITVITRYNEDWIVSLPPEIKRTLGFADNEEVTAVSFSSRVTESKYNEFVGRFGELLDGTSDSLEMDTELYVNESGDSRHFMIRLGALHSGGTPRIIGALIDIDYQAEHLTLSVDGETGLLNQKGFIAGAFASVQGMKRAAMFAVKLTRYANASANIRRRLTDNVSDALKKTAAQGSVAGVAGRIAPDIYAVMIPAQDAAEAEAFALRLKEAVLDNCRESDDNSGEEAERFAEFVAGACFCDNKDDVPTAFSRASLMLYISDTADERICYMYDEKSERNFYERELIAKDVYSALKNNEFVLYYQPKIRFSSGDVFGAEALIRWESPTRGLLSPYSFLSIAERSGILAQLDRWSLTHACLTLRKWQLANKPKLRVSVNVSAQALYQEDFTDVVRRALAESNLQAEYLELEINETFVSQNPERAAAQLQRVKKLGVVLSLDNFGAGYSAFNAIKSLPFDILKIDRSLISDIETNTSTRNMIKSIIDVGRAHNLNVLCEGVETEEQLELLKALGCDEAQGYYVGKPVSGAEMERFLE
jgi:EAL domain-containing protein (putative c-di-GMP-specific phosphodiesterase class I)/GGDEF domain-containing protein